MQRLPHSTCMFCQRTIDEIGGRRLGPWSSASNGLRMAETDKLIDRAEPERAMAIDETDDGKRFIMIWGEKWTDELLDGVIAVIAGGRQPWMCQLCGNRTCRKCGAPLKIAHGAEIVHDDGAIRHQMIVPTNTSCSNPKCERYMEWSPRGWRDPA